MIASRRQMRVLACMLVPLLSAAALAAGQPADGGAQAPAPKLRHPKHGQRALHMDPADMCPVGTVYNAVTEMCECPPGTILRNSFCVTAPPPPTFSPPRPPPSPPAPTGATLGPLLTFTFVDPTFALSTGLRLGSRTDAARAARANGATLDPVTVLTQESERTWMSLRFEATSKDEEAARQLATLLTLAPQGVWPLRLYERPMLVRDVRIDNAPIVLPAGPKLTFILHRSDGSRISNSSDSDGLRYDDPAVPAQLSKVAGALLAAATETGGATEPPQVAVGHLIRGGPNETEVFLLAAVFAESSQDAAAARQLATLLLQQPQSVLPVLASDASLRGLKANDVLLNGKTFVLPSSARPMPTWLIAVIAGGGGAAVLMIAGAALWFHRKAQLKQGQGQPRKKAAESSTPVDLEKGSQAPAQKKAGPKLPSPGGKGTVMGAKAAPASVQVHAHGGTIDAGQARGYKGGPAAAAALDAELQRQELMLMQELELLQAQQAKQAQQAQQAQQGPPAWRSNPTAVE